jgi:CheY-like chemotaxis protein
MKRVLFIEDNPKDLKDISRKLQELNNNYVMYPDKLSDTGVKRYLSSQTDGNKENVVKYINKTNIDIFLIDIEIGEYEKGGLTIYNNIIKDDKKLSTKPVLFVTGREEPKNLPEKDHVRCVQKISNNIEELDSTETANRIENAISSILLTIEHNQIDKTVRESNNRIG